MDDTGDFNMWKDYDEDNEPAFKHFPETIQMYVQSILHNILFRNNPLNPGIKLQKRDTQVIKISVKK